jgi:hypothetical protein
MIMGSRHVRLPILLCGLAILVLPAVAPAFAPAFAEEPSDVGALRAAAARLLADGSADDAVKAADLLDKASQIEARETDTSKAHTALGVLEEVIANGLAPLISTIVLGGTLAFNVYQAKVAEREKRRDDQAKDAQAREDKRRQDEKDASDNLNKIASLLQSSNHSLPTAALIGSLMDGPYRAQARDMGLSVMRSATSLNDFKDLFLKFFRPVTYQNLDDALDYLRECHEVVERLWNISWDDTKKVWDNSRLQPGQLREIEFQSEKRKFLSAQVAELLKQRNATAPALLDLSRLGFEGCDLSGADLHQASIGAGVWRTLVLDKCDFRGVTNFEDFWIADSAWWRAAYIDPPFLALLDSKFGFDNTDWVQRMAGSADTYNKELSRLKTG